MNDRPEPPSMAVSVPMSSGTGMSPSFGVAAPVGAVSRKNRERARETSLRREGTSNAFVLLAALPGSVNLQRRGVDGTWETIDRRPASRLGHTRIELPQEAASPPPTYRVVFSHRNSNITAWISEDIDG